MSILITGVAGFIGVNLAEELLRTGNRVFGVDNLSRGTQKNMSHLLIHNSFMFEHVEMTEVSSFQMIVKQMYDIEEITEVWHLAANSDIPGGVIDPRIDLQDTFITTFNTLEVMKNLQIKTLAFASSSAVYGDHGDKPLTENMGALLPISNYGAMKLASEAAISAAAENFLSNAFIFRFPNVIGVPATHGVMLDFVRKLKLNSSSLNVLGNGSQQKCYMHVKELLDAMLFIRKNAKEKVAIFNIGAEDDGVTVRFIAEETVKVAAPNANILYGVENKGWVGDVPRFIYRVNKLKKLGWAPKLDSKDAVKTAIQQIFSQEENN
jgi:UDP-glucose 4-epimerase